MSQWSNEVMETYRKVQRALTRAQQQQRERSPKKDKKKVESVSAQSEPQAELPIQQDHQLGDQRSRAAPDRSPDAGGTQAEGYMPVLQDDPEEEQPKWNGTRNDAKLGMTIRRPLEKIYLG